MRPRINGVFGLVGIGVMAISVPAYADGPSFECAFNRHYAASFNEDRNERIDSLVSQLSFAGSKTTSTPESVDGVIKATDSTTWTLLRSDDSGAAFVGDTGDLLTILYLPGDGEGIYEASLQSAGGAYAFTSMGLCSGTP